MSFSPQDQRETIDRYTNRYRKLGYGPAALGWDKGKQDIRFDILTSLFECKGKSILDIGCGFGDLNAHLQRLCGDRYTYLGVDLVPDLLVEARRRYAGERVRFAQGEFLSLPLTETFDIAIASGVFNHTLQATANYAFIEATFAKAFQLCRLGLAFDFLSDKVDYRLEHTFHSSPEEILSIAYRYSRNVVLRNDYMPFEFAVFVFKDDGFAREDTVFTRYKRISRREADGSRPCRADTDGGCMQQEERL